MLATPRAKIEDLLLSGFLILSTHDLIPLNLGTTSAEAYYAAAADKEAARRPSNRLRAVSSSPANGGSLSSPGLSGRRRHFQHSRNNAW